MGSELALAGGLAVACVVALAALLRLRAERRATRRLLENLPQTGVAVIGHDLRVSFAAGPVLGMAAPAAEIEGMTVAELLPASQAEAFASHCRATLRGERRSFQLHSQETRRDHWVRLVPLPDAKGEVDSALAVSLDISDRGQIDRELGSGPADVDAIADVTRSLARSVDPDSARAAICEGARKIAEAPIAALFEPGPGGLIAKASVGVDLRDLELPVDGDSGVARAFARAQESFVIRDRDGDDPDGKFFERTRSTAVLWHPVVRDQTAIGVLAVAWREGVAGVSLRLSALIDVLGAEAAVAIGRADMLGRLERQARTDALTGLPNRRHWEQQLPRELSRSWREQQPVCVAMFDLDHFKDFNDRRGHQAGDRLLREAAASWRNALRSYDVLARYGGEEFAVILPGCDLGDGLALVERLRAATPAGESCSAGIAQWDGEEKAETLVGRADAALYRAKRAGRDRVVTAPAR